MRSLLLMLALVAMASVMASADMIAFDSFEGPDANDVDASDGGSGWGGAWVDSNGTVTQFVFTAPGTVVEGFNCAGSKATYIGNGAGTNTRYKRSLSSPVTVDASNPELWASYILDLQETQSGRGCGVELTNGGTSVVAIGKGVNASIMIGTAFTTNKINTTLATKGISLLVVKLAFDGTNTIATIYGAKGTEDGFDVTDISTFPAAGTASITLTGPVTIDGVTLYGYNGATKTNSIDEVRVAKTYANFFDLVTANAPDPESGATVLPTVDLSWSAPNTYVTTGYDVYFGTDPNKLNLARIGDKIADEFIIDPAGAGLDLEFDTTYYWSVDAYEPNGVSEDVRPGSLWNFTTVPANVLLNSGPASVTVAGGSVVELTVDALYVDTYVWYKNNIAISGADTETLVITGAAIGDEGDYHCEISNAISGPLATAPARLMIERLIGHWEFDGSLAAAVGTDAVLSDPDATNAIEAAISYETAEDAVVGAGAIVISNVATVSETFLDVPGTADLYNFYPEGLTVSVWVKTPAGASGYQDIVEKMIDDGATRWFLRLAGTNGLFRMGPAGVFTGASINDGDWKYLAVTYDATVGEATMYLNGTARATAAMSPTSAGNIANLIIGDGFNGSIDDLKIYTYPISSDVIAQDYIAATGKPLCVNPGFVGSGYDFNGDCVVDMLDFAKIAEVWLNNGLYQAPN